VIALATFAFLTSAVLGRQLLAVWVGHEIAGHSSTLLVIHMATFGLLASTSVAWNVTESFGRARLNVMFSMTWMLAGAAMMFALGSRFGLEGVAFGRLIGCLAVIPLAVFVESRILRSFSARFWMILILRLAAAAAVASAAEALMSGWLPGVAALLLGTLLGAAVFGSVLLLVGFFTEDELNWLRNSLTLAKA
jgi:O-antigen/teichoic acid export membrane protein